MDKHQHDIDQFNKNLLRQTGLESPSMDFTQDVMAMIQQEATPSITPYKPVISKFAWGMILVGMAALLVVVALGWNDPGLVDHTSQPSAWQQFSNTLPLDAVSQAYSWLRSPVALAGVFALVLFTLVDWALIRKQVLQLQGN